MNKKKIFLLLTGIFLFLTAHAQSDPAIAFAKNLVNFLGSQRDISDISRKDHVVYFDYNDNSHAITVKWKDPVYTVFINMGSYSIGGNKGLELFPAIEACNEVNNTMGCVKLYCDDEDVWINVEQFTRSFENFKSVLKQNLQKLADADDEFMKQYRKFEKNTSTSQSSNSGATQTSKNQAPTTQTSAPAKGNLSDFFPIYGITLGKTTTNDLKRMGYDPKPYDKESNTCDVETIAFWDMDGDNVYDWIYMTCYDKMPPLWQEKFGFKWELSYDEWMALFKRLNFTIKIIKSPITDTYEKRNVLSAEFEALSADKLLEFDLNFNYGNHKGEGDKTSSKSSLYGVHVRYRGK